MMSVLYLSYDGLLEPLGQSQVYQYLQKLAQSHEITLVSYEKKHDWANGVRRNGMLRAVEEAGIRWIPLRYHKRPSVLATAYDLAVGLVVCLYLCLRRRVQIVHGRGYVISVLGLGLKRMLKCRLIFDTRSFWPDERVELGIWNKESLIYRISKWLERRLLMEADVVVALTPKAVDLLRKYPCLHGQSKHFEVIPTCTNLDLFRPAMGCRDDAARVREGLFTLGYVGNAGTAYLFDAVLECFKLLQQRRPKANLLIINRNDHAYILERLKRGGVRTDSVEIKAVEHREVPKEMGRMDAGIFLIAPQVSRVSAVPTKMGEFLACGVPCLANSGVGNVKEVLENDRVGVVLDEFDMQAMRKAVDQLLDLVEDPEVQRRCVSVAQRYFSLERGVQAYDCIYRELLGKSA
jgi:glycosyltransferase involved in cell wall biosynthesis